MGHHALAVEAEGEQRRLLADSAAFNRHKRTPAVATVQGTLAIVSSAVEPSSTNAGASLGAAADGGRRLWVQGWRGCACSTTVAAVAASSFYGDPPPRGGCTVERCVIDEGGPAVESVKDIASESMCAQ